MRSILSDSNEDKMCENIWRIMKENKFEFDNEINHKLKCNICNELIIRACNAPCGCLFCFDCIENYLNENDKFCPGKSKRCHVKMINYAKDIVFDNRANIQISEIVVKCPRQNCQFKDALERIENHMRTCEKRPISCPYHEIGCEMNEVMNDDMKDHLNEENYCHSKLIIDSINNLRNEIESMKNEIIEFRRENNQFKEENDKIKLQSTDENVDKIYEENANFETRLNYFDERLKEIFDENLNYLQIKMIKMETRLRHLETYGEFKWKLQNLSQENRYSWLDSRPFYSWKFGYKICLCVYIWSWEWIIYLNFMKGEFDNELEWPCKCSVTIDVIGQKNGNIYLTNTKKYSDCPDYRWNRPSTDRNDGILFHRTPIASAVVRCNQIIVKCNVDREIKSITN